MSAGLPNSSAQAVRVLFRMAVRRFYNRWQSMRLARKKPVATVPAKRDRHGWQVDRQLRSTAVFFFVIFTFQWLQLRFPDRLAQLAQSRATEVGAAPGQIFRQRVHLREPGSRRRKPIV